MDRSIPEFDVGIIGGGPGGAAMAAYLAKAGVKCAVFESDVFPRPHVGESLVPSAMRVFNDLDFISVMEEAKFPKKYGAVWTAANSFTKMNHHNFEGISPDCHAQIKFDERVQAGVNRPYTYHVDRGRFDSLLLRHAHSLGAKVLQGVNVTNVDFSAPNPVIHYKIGAQEIGTTVRMVVDASGRRTFLGNQLKLKVMDPVFDQYALHAWFEGFDRNAIAKGEGQEDYIYIHFLPISNTWIWQIPITDTITSIGVVAQKKNFSKSRESRENFFWNSVGTRPELLEALKKSKQLRPLKDEGDYSYAMSQITGDRFVVIGDAARFVDPIFSTGVSIALNSARFASRDVIEAVKTGNFKRDAFQTYETTIGRGTKNWYDFITVYYRLNVLFTYFVNEKKYRLDVLKLLQGDVYDEEQPQVLQEMRKLVTEVEQNKDHLWHGLLNDLTSQDFQPKV